MTLVGLLHGCKQSKLWISKARFCFVWLLCCWMWCQGLNSKRGPSLDNLLHMFLCMCRECALMRTLLGNEWIASTLLQMCEKQTYNTVLTDISYFTNVHGKMSLCLFVWPYREFSSQYVIGFILMHTNCLKKSLHLNLFIFELNRASLKSANFQLIMWLFALVWGSFIWWAW